MNLADQRGRGDANAPGHLEQVYTIYLYNQTTEYTEIRRRIWIDRYRQIMQLNLEKDNIMMHTLYEFRYSHKVIDKFKFPVRRNDMCSETVLRSGCVYDRKQY